MKFCAYPSLAVGDLLRVDGNLGIGKHDAEPFIDGLHHVRRDIAQLVALEVAGAGGAYAGLIFRFIFVGVTHGCILLVKVRSGVPEPIKKPGVVPGFDDSRHEKRRTFWGPP